MRRVLIFIMLSFILYSMFSSLIPTWTEPDSYKMLLDTVYGVVYAGNFSYWTFGQKGPLIIELTSVTGDADLFVGDNLRTSYEPDRHNFSSETCGIDLVFVPASFPRPIVIGVYGHWPNNRSQYSMKVFTDLEKSRMGKSFTGASDERTTAASHERLVENSRSNLREKPPMRTEVTRMDDEGPHFFKLSKILDSMIGLL